MLSNIDRRVVAMISEASKIPESEIDPESRLDELEIDSLVIVELSFKLRKEFDIDPETDRQLDDAETVGQIIDLVRKVTAR